MSCLPEQGYLLSRKPDRMLACDVSYVSRERAADAPREGVHPGWRPTSPSRRSLPTTPGPPSSRSAPSGSPTACAACWAVEPAHATRRRLPGRRAARRGGAGRLRVRGPRAARVLHARRRGLRRPLISSARGSRAACRRGAAVRRAPSARRGPRSRRPPRQQLAGEGDGGLERAARGDHVVHHHHAFLRAQRVAVDLQHGPAVLELELARDDGPGSLPALRTGTKPAPSRSASGAPNRKPRLSMPRTFEIRSRGRGPSSPSTTPANASGCASSGVMSRNRIPSSGSRGRRG